MAKLTKNRMSITSLDRISPMFFDGPYDGTVPMSSDGNIIYNERCVDPDIEHVASGAYRERCVDPELEEENDNYYQVGNNRFSKRRVSRSRKTSRQSTTKKESPYRASTSSSDLERAMIDNGLHISGSETDDSETSSSPGGLYCSQNRGTSPIVESPSSDRLTITGDSKSYQSFGSYSSSKTPPLPNCCARYCALRCKVLCTAVQWTSHSPAKQCPALYTAVRRHHGCVH